MKKRFCLLCVVGMGTAVCQTAVLLFERYGETAVKVRTFV